MYILTYRFSLLGDFFRFTPTTSNIIAWSQAFQEKGYEFLPNIVSPELPVLQLLPVQPLSQDKRVQFITPNGDMIVRIFANRVDAECTLIETDTPDSVLAEKFSTIEDVIRTVLSALGNAKGTRVAYYIDAFLPESSPDSFDEKCAKYNLGLTIPNFVNCSEWTHRFNSRTKLTIGSKEEVCNAIFSLESSILNTQNNTTGEQTEINGIHITADINTLAEESEERFDVDWLIKFCKSAQVFYLDMYNQIKTRFI